MPGTWVAEAEYQVESKGCCEVKTRGRGVRVCGHTWVGWTRAQARVRQVAVHAEAILQPGSHAPQLGQVTCIDACNLGAAP